MAGSIVVRVLVFFAKDPWFAIHLEPLVGSLLTVHPVANGDLVETLGR